MKKLLFAIALTAIAAPDTKAQQRLLPYQDPSLTSEERANDLLTRLTLEEKTLLMMDTSPAIDRLGIPQFQCGTRPCMA